MNRLFPINIIDPRFSNSNFIRLCGKKEIQKFGSQLRDGHSLFLVRYFPSLRIIYEYCNFIANSIDMQQFAVNSSSVFESVRHYFNMIRITLAPMSSRKFDVLSNREITPALPAFTWFHVADKYFRAKETPAKSFPVHHPSSFAAFFRTRRWNGQEHLPGIYTHVVCREVNDSCRQFVHTSMFQ